MSTTTVTETQFLRNFSHEEGSELSLSGHTSSLDDGIVDSVELANGMNPLNEADADFDNDGFSNSLELSFGSAMRNANDHPTWVPIALGDIMTIIPFYNK
ncbi:MAG: hypothetical protein U9N11_07705 [Campylobacterota bacterium]|nr:hypothetical protein [Campylobacterota bacterium]